MGPLCTASLTNTIDVEIWGGGIQLLASACPWHFLRIHRILPFIVSLVDHLLNAGIAIQASWRKPDNPKWLLQLGVSGSRKGILVASTGLSQMGQQVVLYTQQKKSNEFPSLQCHCWMEMLSTWAVGKHMSFVQVQGNRIIGPLSDPGSEDKQRHVRRPLSPLCQLCPFRLPQLLFGLIHPPPSQSGLEGSSRRGEGCTLEGQAVPSARHPPPTAEAKGLVGCQPNWSQGQKENYFKIATYNKGISNVFIPFSSVMPQISQPNDYFPSLRKLLIHSA